MTGRPLSYVQATPTPTHNEKQHCTTERESHRTRVRQLSENLKRQGLTAVETALGLALLILEIESQPALTSPGAGFVATGNRGMANRRLRGGVWLLTVGEGAAPIISGSIMGGEQPRLADFYQAPQCLFSIFAPHSCLQRETNANAVDCTKPR